MDEQYDTYEDDLMERSDDQKESFHEWIETFSSGKDPTKIIETFKEE